MVHRDSVVSLVGCSEQKLPSGAQRPGSAKGQPRSRNLLPTGLDPKEKQSSWDWSENREGLEDQGGTTVATGTGLDQDLWPGPSLSRGVEQAES